MKDVLRDRSARTGLYERYSKASDAPLLVLALLMVPIILAPEVTTLSAWWENLLDTANWLIYAAFATDFVLKVYLAPSAWRHVRENWIDVIVLALPLLRPLRLVSGARLLRLLRAARLLTFGVLVVRKLRGILVGRGLHWVLLVTLGILLGSAALVAVFERESGGSINGFGDALWWALTTVTTVGYGDTFPVTPEGRGIAVFLMLTGIAFFGILTANVAAFFVESGTAREQATIGEKLDLIAARLDALEAKLDRPRRFEENAPPEPARDRTS